MTHLERALDKQNQWWKYLVIFLAGFIAANLIGAIPLGIVIEGKTLQNSGEAFQKPDNVLDFSAYGIDPNIGLILVMIPFIVGLITVILLFKPVHKRSFKEVINGTNSVRWNRFFFATLVWGLLMALYLVIDYSVDPKNFTLNFNITSFIPLVIISLLLIPLQTTYEEVLFRGYLAQGVAAWTNSRWMAVVIPAILFGLMHWINPEVKEYGFWVTMPQYIIFGLLFGLVTVFDDGIEAAMGMHAANNMFASIFITHKASALQTSALFLQQHVDPVKETWVALIFGVIFIFILKRQYKWDFSILNRKVAL